MISQKDFISLSDYNPEEIIELLDLADQLKADNKAGRSHHLLKEKTLGMIFAKSSTRTRISFEVGIYQLGGMGIFLNNNDIQLGRGETVEDSARVMSRYLDGLMIRTYSHSSVVRLAAHSTIPVINGLTDLEHPCQVLCDLMTIREKKGTLGGLKLAYIGDGNNMANSLLQEPLWWEWTSTSPHLPDTKPTRSAFNRPRRSPPPPIPALKSATIRSRRSVARTPSTRIPGSAWDRNRKETNAFKP